MAWATSPDHGGYSYESAESTTAVLSEIGRVIGANASALLNAVRGLPAEAGTDHFRWIVSSFGPQALAALTAELSAEPSGPHQGNLIAACVGRWTRQDSPAALRAIAELPVEFAEQARKALLGSLGAQGIAKLPLAEQVAFIRQLQTDPALASASTNLEYGYLIAGLADREPAMAVELLQAASGTEQDHAWTEVFRSWVSSHPVAAAERALILPEAQRGPAVAGLVQGWVEFDPMAASLWASCLVEGTGRDQAAAGLAHALKSVEPASAFSWAASIGDAKTAQPVLEATLQAWIALDAAAAGLALENSALPDPRKAEFRKLFPEVVR